MSERTDDLNILQIRPLISPAVLAEELPTTSQDDNFIRESRGTVRRILSSEDPRLLVVVGPCSIHDPAAAVEYAEQLQDVAERLADRLFLVMRVYFEKPRTVMGWKGLINDPDLDCSYRINRGLRLARTFLLDICKRRLPAATEFLDTTFGQFYTDLVTWGAIGARTAESQVHRELASGMSMPVGIKNRTDGNLQVAVDAILAARNRHFFPSLTKDGAPAVFETRGNADGHLVLRGGSDTGPNYSQESIAKAVALLTASGLPPAIMVDLSHGNSDKHPRRQRDVAQSVAEQLAQGNSPIRGVMIESHLVAGRQDIDAPTGLTYGQSITDACLSFDETVPVLELLADSIRLR
ncbi:MAG: 3-deoxy-7-phosphoheptulonate synthase [Planctomycetaceae bacterium]